jgi:hypothetical protein
MADQHHASKAGSKYEKELVDLVKSFNLTINPKKQIRDLPASYKEAGFQFFWDDGSVPDANIDHIELKGGEKNGTTHEKLMFDLEKIRDGVYKGNLLYIFKGIMETHKVTKLFIRKLSTLNLPNVQVMMYSDLTKETLLNVFA